MLNRCAGACWALLFCIAVLTACQQSDQNEEYVSILNLGSEEGGRYQLSGSPMLVVRFGQGVSRDDFSAKLNGKSITELFNVLPGQQVLVDLPTLRAQAINILELSVGGGAGKKKYSYSIEYVSKSHRASQRGSEGILEGEVSL